MPMINLDAYTIYYQASSPAPSDGTILFIHGSGASGESWREQMNSLPPGFLGLAPDLPAHGQSSGPALNQVEALASVAVEVVRQLTPPRPLFIAGHSLGAAIALHAARFYPELMDAVILLGGGARMRVLPTFLDQLAQGEADVEFFRLAFGPEANPSLVESELARYAQVSPGLLYHDFSACNDFDLSPEIPYIDLPVLLVVGEHDRLTPPKYSLSLQEKLPRAQLNIIPGAGHFAMLEKPGPVNQAINDFVANY